MDLEKIGNFIHELRIKKNFTQEQLAEKIHVTNKAISKWENGNGLPDISLLESLANELEVSVLELLRGEYIQNNSQTDKGDINILLNTLIHTIREKKFRKKIMFFVISITIILSIFLFYMYRRFDGIQGTFFANDYYEIFDIFYPIPLQTTIETIISWIYDPSTIDVIGFFKNIFINIIMAILISSCLLTFMKNKKKYIIVTVSISFILELSKWLLRMGIYDADDIILRTFIGLLIFNFHKKFLIKGCD